MVDNCNDSFSSNNSLLSCYCPGLPKVCVVSLQKLLRSLVSRRSKDDSPRSSLSTPAATTSHVNYRYLSPTEKDQRLRGLHSQYRCSAKRARRLEEKIKALIYGEVFDEGMNSYLTQIMHDCNEKVTNENPEGSLPRIFWEQQLKAASCADKQQICWHPVSGACRSAYETLRSYGCLSLPSQRTLRDITLAQQSGFPTKLISS